MRREFSVQYLRADGEPEGPEQPMTWPEARTALALRWPRQCALARLHHFFALCRAGTGHPVDAVAMDDTTGAVLFSARLRHLGGNHGTQA